jgi:surfeit locus 1 family protein
MRTASFAVAALVAALVCGWLGFWQLERLDQRRAENAVIEERLTFPSVSITPQFADTSAYQTVSASGIYDPERTVVEVFRSRNGIPGIYLVSPLMLNDSVAVLVERGWAPAPDARSVDVAQFERTDSVGLDGYLHPFGGVDSVASVDNPSWPRFVRSANPLALGGLFPYRLLPVVIRRTGGMDSDQLRTLDVPAMDEGTHLSYAVQWFSFAIIALVGGFIWIRQKGRESPS